MTPEELKEIIARHESETVELKEWKNSISVLGGKKFENRTKSIFGYCVAMGNEEGGNLIIGVNDKGGIVGTTAEININKAKQQVFRETGQKINIEEVIFEEKQVLVISIPSRQVGEILKYAGVPPMRVGESLEIMSDAEQRRILLETENDFSAQIVPSASITDLDTEALKILESLYNNRNNTNVAYSQLLQDLGLVRGESITYAALVLLGLTNSLRDHLGNSEIIFQYRNDKNTIEYSDRVDYRKAFLLLQQELWEKISSRNQITQIQEGFLTKEIPSFNEKVIKESILNAVAHRDYRDSSSIIVKQSPQEIEIQNPGGLVSGVDIENILVTTKPRNRLIAEIFQHLGFVQRAGQGMDTIFQETITEGKGVPDLSASDNYHVTLKISAQVKNKDFLKFLEKVANEKQIIFSLDDILLLQEVYTQSKKFTKDELQKFLDLGIVEQVGKTRGAKYILSHTYYTAQNETGVHTRISGISRDVKKHLILTHLSKNTAGAVLDDFVDAFPDIKRKDISNLLQELKKAGKIINVGATNGAVWKLANNE